VRTHFRFNDGSGKITDSKEPAFELRRFTNQPGTRAAVENTFLAVCVYYVKPSGASVGLFDGDTYIWASSRGSERHGPPLQQDNSLFYTRKSPLSGGLCIYPPVVGTRALPVQRS